MSSQQSDAQVIGVFPRQAFLELNAISRPLHERDRRRFFGPFAIAHGDHLVEFAFDESDGAASTPSQELFPRRGVAFYLN